MYRKFLSYQRDRESIKNNYLIISSLIDINKLTVRSACLLNQYMNGSNSREVDIFLNYIDQVITREYIKNEIKWADNMQYKDWLDIDKKHIIKLRVNEYQKRHKEKAKKEMEEFMKRYHLQGN